MSNLIITILLYVAILWELVWKGIALWKCGRRDQMTWFVLIFLLNTLGILPIVYLLISKDSKKPVTKKGKKKVVKK